MTDIKDFDFDDEIYFEEATGISYSALRAVKNKLKEQR